MNRAAFNLPPPPSSAEAQPQTQLSFNELTTRTYPLSRGTIERMVVGDMSVYSEADTKNVIQRWSTLTSPNPEEVQLSQTPGMIADLHQRTAQMMARNTNLWVSSAVRAQREVGLRTARNAQRQALQHDDGSALMGTLLSGKGTQLGRTAGYARLLVGNTDLTHRFGAQIDGVRAVVTYQSSEGEPTFIHWSTIPLLDRQVHTGSRPQLSRRIYLNPRMREQPEIFEELMKTLDSAGLIAAGKMLDRSQELAHNHLDVARRPQDKEVRTDGIVIAVADADADSALAIVQNLYTRHRSALQGRPTPRLAMGLRDTSGRATGIAVSSQPRDAKKYSHTLHRASVLTDATRDMRGRFGLKPGDTINWATMGQGLYRTWVEHARRAGINPNNIAFNT